MLSNLDTSTYCISIIILFLILIIITEGYESVEILIKFGVPQGSVLGPVLLNIYIRSLYNTVHYLNFSIHGFADDHQIFKSFNMGQQFNVLACKLPQLFNQIKNWMTSQFLLLNPGKTEIIVFGSQSTMSSEIIYGTFLSSSICIRFRVCKAPPLFQIKPDFFLVVRLVPKNICMKSEVNRSTFTGSRLRF